MKTQAPSRYMALVEQQGTSPMDGVGSFTAISIRSIQMEWGWWELGFMGGECSSFAEFIGGLILLSKNNYYYIVPDQNLLNVGVGM